MWHLDGCGESSVAKGIQEIYIQSQLSRPFLIHTHHTSSTMVQGRHLEMGDSRCRVVGDCWGKDQTRNNNKTERRCTWNNRSNRPGSPYRLNSRNTHYAWSPAGVTRARLSQDAGSTPIRWTMCVRSSFSARTYRGCSTTCPSFELAALHHLPWRLSHSIDGTKSRPLALLRACGKPRPWRKLERSGSEPSVARKPIAIVPRKKEAVQKTVKG